MPGHKGKFYLSSAFTLNLLTLVKNCNLFIKHVCIFNM